MNTFLIEFLSGDKVVRIKHRAKSKEAAEKTIRKEYELPKDKELSVTRLDAQQSFLAPQPKSRAYDE